MAKTRRLQSVAWLIALLVLAAACGDAGTEGGPQAGDDVGADASPGDDAEATDPETEGGGAESEAALGEQDPEDVTGTVDVMMFQAYIDDEDYAAFNERYPNVQVNHEHVPPGEGYENRLRTLTATGDLPDVFGSNVAALALAEEGLLLDLTEVLQTPNFEGDAPWGDSLDPTIMDNLRSKIPEDLRTNGEEWAVPFGAISLAVVYNVEIFDELGLEAPETWDEFMENNRTLRDAGYAPMSLTGELWKNWWPRIVLDQTARDVTVEDVTSGEVSFTDPRLVEAYEIVQQMYAEGVFPDGGLNHGVEESQALFASGKMAQFLTVPENFVQYLVENSPFEVSAYVLPGAKGVEPVRTLGGSGSLISVKEDAENLEAAVAVAKYLTSETLFTDVLADHFVVAPTKGGADTASGEIMSVYGEAAANGYIPPTLVPATQLPPEAAGQIENELLPALYTGELTPEEFARELEAVYDTGNQ